MDWRKRCRLEFMSPLCHVGFGCGKGPGIGDGKYIAELFLLCFMGAVFECTAFTCRETFQGDDDQRVLSSS